MKTVKKILLGLVAILAIAALLLVVTGHSHVFKAVASTYLVGKSGPTIQDQDKFVNRTVEADQHQAWPVSSGYNQYNLSDFKGAKQIDSLEPAALLVVKNDSILFEEYWDGYDSESLTNSFSVAKTFVGILIGIAIDEGKINSLDDPVGNYLEEYAKSPELTIRDLITMSSGINFDENYKSPFGYMAKAYYGTDLKELTANYEVAETPGETWKYLGGNTIILSFVLEKATGQTLSDYMSEKLWKPLGAKNDALWTLDDENGYEKAYCCFYSNARDFARIGQLYLDGGLWNGKRIVSSKFVEESIRSAFYLKNKEGKPVDFYGYHWWITYYNNMDIFYARGIQGQFIIVIPEKDMVVVRLGNKRGVKLPNEHPSDLYTYIDFALAL